MDKAIAEFTLPGNPGQKLKGEYDSLKRSLRVKKAVRDEMGIVDDDEEP